jgi:hypothetical protein
MKGGEGNEENGEYLFGIGDVGDLFVWMRNTGRCKD